MEAHTAWKTQNGVPCAEKHIDATRGMLLHGVVLLHKVGVHAVYGQGEHIAHTRAAQ
jgi:hypothetical protein